MIAKATALAGPAGVLVDQPGFHVLRIGEVDLRIERYHEFTSFTIIAPIAAAAPFAARAYELLLAGLTPGRFGRLIQRLLEIEVYRLMALLALPLAREYLPRIEELERSHAELVERLGIAPGAGADELACCAAILARSAENSAGVSTAASGTYPSAIVRRGSALPVGCVTTFSLTNSRLGAIRLSWKPSTVAKHAKVPPCASRRLAK